MIPKKIVREIRNGYTEKTYQEQIQLITIGLSIIIHL